MSKPPLVSVIVPNYNHARYLGQRLQSILNQTYRNIEVIILDDCSTDNSLEVIDKYTSDPRIVSVIVNEKNSGSTFLQWDKGLHLAKGELVWIAESDDYCELNMLQELVSAINKKSGTVIAYTDMVPVNIDGNPLSRFDLPMNRWEHSNRQTNIWTKIKHRSIILLCDPLKFTNRYLSSNSFYKKYLAPYCAIKNASGAIFKRSAALKISSKYLSINAAGDYMFWAELSEMGKVAIVNKPLSYFRRHTNTVSHIRNIDGTNFIAEKEVYDFICNRVRITKLREHIIMAQRIKRIKEMPFIDSESKKKVYELWNVNKYSSLFDKIMIKLCLNLNRYLRIHL